LLGADNVNNTLALVSHTKVGQAKVLHVLLESGALQAGVVLLDKIRGVLEVFPRASRDVLWDGRTEISNWS
jgi:hypothetical protein